ncbi:hypothetical protein GJ496_006368 [Pomphorhynchus laevis]|nr:hypothetical protein GJ496_006368 [Pomphorhynchus laevis]
MEVLDLVLNYAITRAEFDRHVLVINVKKVATTFEDENRNAVTTNTLGRQLFEKYVTKKCCDTGPININKQNLKALSIIRVVSLLYGRAVNTSPRQCDISARRLTRLRRLTIWSRKLQQ